MAGASRPETSSAEIRLDQVVRRQMVTGTASPDDPELITQVTVGAARAAGPTRAAESGAPGFGFVERVPGRALHQPSIE